MLLPPAHEKAPPVPEDGGELCEADCHVDDAMATGGRVKWIDAVDALMGVVDQAFDGCATVGLA